MIDGRRWDIGLGSYSAISLAQARTMAASNRTAVSEGRDPMAEKQAAREAARNPDCSVPTFAEAAGRGPRDRVASPHMEQPETRRPVEIDSGDLRFPGDRGEAGRPNCP